MVLRVDLHLSRRDTGLLKSIPLVIFLKFISIFRRFIDKKGLNSHY
jgi:hypothetical protein